MRPRLPQEDDGRTRSGAARSDSEEQAERSRAVAFTTMRERRASRSPHFGRGRFCKRAAPCSVHLKLEIHSSPIMPSTPRVAAPVHPRHPLAASLLKLVTPGTSRLERSLYSRGRRSRDAPHS